MSDISHDTLLWLYRPIPVNWVGKRSGYLTQVKSPTIYHPSQASQMGSDHFNFIATLEVWANSEALDDLLRGPDPTTAEQDDVHAFTPLVDSEHIGNNSTMSFCTIAWNNYLHDFGKWCYTHAYNLLLSILKKKHRQVMPMLSWSPVVLLNYSVFIGITL